MKNIVYTAIAAAGLAWGASAQAATVSIDTFNDDQGEVTASAGGTTVDSKATASAIGGVRTISVTNVSGPLDTSGIAIAAGGGLFSFSNDAQTQGIASLIYDAGGVDLTDGGTNDQFLIDVIAIDLGMRVSLTIDGEENYVDVMGNGDISFAFADYMVADLSDVNEIIVTFDSNGVDAVDATVDFVGAVSTIPLPAGGLLLLSGLAGVAALRRKAA